MPTPKPLFGADDAPSPSPAKTEAGAKHPQAIQLGAPSSPQKRGIKPSVIMGGDNSFTMIESLSGEFCTKKGLPKDKADSVKRQAFSMISADSETIDSWGAQTLDNYTASLNKTAALRDKISATGMGDILAEFVRQLSTQSAEKHDTGFFSKIFDVKTEADRVDIDKIQNSTSEAQRLLKDFLDLVKKLEPENTAISMKMAVTLTALEVALEYFKTKENVDVELINRISIRQDLFSRSVVQFNLLIKIMSTLKNNISTWIDEATYIQNVLIPAKRLVK